MSYILDALKKSEQERGHGNIPDVQTVHSSSLNYRNDKNVYWPYLLIVAVLLNLLAITYFIINKENTIETQTTVQKNDAIEQVKTDNSITAEDTALPVTAAAAVNSNKNMEVTEPLVDTTSATDNTAILSTNSTAKSVDKGIQYPDKTEPENTKPVQRTINNASSVIEFYDLPESIKQQLPAIIISAHIYSSNPLQRSIVINNNFMEEGEYVIDGLILYEITPDGAIFNYQGTLFNYGVVSGWQ